jgi:hypothetical protein
LTANQEAAGSIDEYGNLAGFLGQFRGLVFDKKATAKDARADARLRNTFPAATTGRLNC